MIERRILKDFHIGLVEGLERELSEDKNKDKNVFGQIAKIIGRRNTQRRSTKDWNELVRKNTSHKDPIGTTEEAEHARQRRQSLRNYILTNTDKAPTDLDANKLLEYNPRLSNVPPTARLAYVKFMTSKMKTETDSQSEDNAEANNVKDEKKVIGTNRKSILIKSSPAEAVKFHETSEKSSSPNTVKFPTVDSLIAQTPSETSTAQHLHDILQPQKIGTSGASKTPTSQSSDNILKSSGPDDTSQITKAEVELPLITDIKSQVSMEPPKTSKFESPGTAAIPSDTKLTTHVVFEHAESPPKPSTVQDRPSQNEDKALVQPSKEDSPIPLPKKRRDTRNLNWI